VEDSLPSFEPDDIQLVIVEESFLFFSLFKETKISIYYN
jgi:hypothetical protein